MAKAKKNIFHAHRQRRKNAFGLQIFHGHKNGANATLLLLRQHETTTTTTSHKNRKNAAKRIQINYG